MLTQNTPTFLKIARKYIKYSVFICAALFSLLIAITMFLLSKPGQPWLIQLLSHQLHAQEGFHVSFEQISAGTSQTLTIRELAITSHRGRRLAYFPEINLHFSITQLLHGSLPLETIDIPKVDIDGPTLQRLLQLDTSNTPQRSRLDIPRWLIAGNLRLNIDHLTMLQTTLDPLAIRALLTWNPLQQHIDLHTIEKISTGDQPQVELHLTRGFETINARMMAKEIHRSELLKNSKLHRCLHSSAVVEFHGTESAWKGLNCADENKALVYGHLGFDLDTPLGPISGSTELTLGNQLQLKTHSLDLQLLGWLASGMAYANAQTQIFELSLKGPIEKVYAWDVTNLNLQDPYATLEMAGNTQNFEGSIELKATHLSSPLLDDLVQKPVLWTQIHSGLERPTQIDTSLQATYQDQPFNLETKLHYDQDRWFLEKIQATSKGLQADVHPTEDSNNPGWSVELHLDCQRSKLAGTLVNRLNIRAGSLELFAHSTSWDPSNMLVLDFDAHMQELLYGPWHISQLKGTGRLRLDPQNIGQVGCENLRVELDQLESPHYFIADQVACNCWGSNQALFFHANANRNSRLEGDDTPYDIKAEGLIDLSHDALRISIEDIQGTWSGLVVKMHQSSLLEFSPNLLQCGAIEVGLGEGNFFFQASRSPEQVKINAKLSRIPLSLAGLLIGRPLWGQVSGNLSLDSSEGSCMANLDLQMQNLRTQSELTAGGEVTGQIIAHCDAEEFALTTQLIHPHDALYVSTHGHWGALTKPSSWANWGSDEPHNANLRIEGRLGLFSRLFTVEDFDFDGYVDGYLHTWGTPSKASTEGTIDIKQGSYDHYSIGLKIRDIEAYLHGDGEVIILDRLEGVDPLGGRAKAQGKLFLTAGLRSFSQLHFERFCFLHKPFATAWATGDCEFNHRGFSAELKGDLTLEKADITIPDLLPSAVPELSAYTIVRHPSRQAITPSWMDGNLEHPSGVISFDLGVKLSQNISLDGRGLQSSWSGDLRILGHDEHPLIHGRVKLVEGTLLFAGRRFIVREGEVEFAGDPKNDTQIHCISELKADQATIRALLHGSLLHPRLQFQSTPQMSLADLFSHVLFGKAYGSLSAFQALQVAQLALETKGDPNTDLFTQLRKSSGVDRIEIETKPGTLTDADGEIYTLKLGKYVADGFLVGISKNVTTEGTQVTLEIDLTKHLSLITEIGYLSDSSLNLMWKKDY